MCSGSSSTNPPSNRPSLCEAPPLRRKSPSAGSAWAGAVETTARPAASRTPARHRQSRDMARPGEHDHTPGVPFVRERRAIPPRPSSSTATPVSGDTTSSEPSAAAARSTLPSSGLPAVDHAREGASPASNSCVLQLHVSRARRRRVSERPGGRSMFLEHPFRASIWNTRRPSLLPYNARAGRDPVDRRSVESAAPLRPSLRSRHGTAHAAVSFSLLRSRPRCIGT